MAINVDDLLPSAADMKKKVAVAEAEKASEYARKQAAADAEKKALFDQLQKPSGVSDEERLKRAATIINRAVNNGATEVLVGRFPNLLFTDKGRAINNFEKDWPETLTGRPRQAYEFWRDHLKQSNYKLSATIVDWPNGLPGDVAFFLSWS